MKKALAILLISIHLYNLAGYMAMFQYFIYQSNKQTEQQISQGTYNPNDLVEIKIPIHLPYVRNWGGYEQINGTVQLKNNMYNYAFMKMTQDTLFVMCIPNYKTTKLIKANLIYAREVSDVPLNPKKQATQVKSINLFKSVLQTTAIEIKPLVLPLRRGINRLNINPIILHYDVPDQPPEYLHS